MLPAPWITSGTITTTEWVELFNWGGKWRVQPLGGSGGGVLVTTLTESLSAGGSAMTAAGETVWDYLMATGDSIGNGTKVIADEAQDGKWYVIAVPCEDATT